MAVNQIQPSDCFNGFLVVIGVVFVIQSLESYSLFSHWSRIRYLVIGVVFVIQSLESYSLFSHWSLIRYSVIGVLFFI